MVLPRRWRHNAAPDPVDRTTTMSTPSTLGPVMTPANQEVLRKHLSRSENAALDTALRLNKPVDAAMMALDAAGRVGADHPDYEPLWTVYRETIEENEARWRARFEEFRRMRFNVVG